MSTTSQAPLTSGPTVGGVSNNETVSGQINKLIADDSPIMQAARARAQQLATGRGLQNSSIAAQAGEKAVLDSALPIAQQDASTFATREQNNLNTVNQFGLAEADTSNKKELIDSQTASSIAVNNASQAGQSRLLAQESAQRLTEANALANSQERQMALDNSYKLIQQAAAAGQQLQLADKNFQNQQALLMVEYGQKVGLTEVEQANQLERMNLQHQETLAQIKAQAQASTAAQVVPALQSQYLTAVSNRQAATSQEISTIYSTQGLTASQQQTAVQNAYNRLNTDLTAISAYYKQSPYWDPNWGKNSPPVPVTPSVPTTPPPYTLPPGFHI